MKNNILIILAVIAIWFIFFRQPTIELGPGVMAPDDPIQQKLDEEKIWLLDDYKITALAQFSITAKVLSRSSYHSGREADLSPLDLALGWGRMSDETVLSTIEISQSNRWYRWKTQQLPIPKREIETHSANMHLIPANDEVESQMKDVSSGEIVDIEGYLVQVNAADGWSWRSSLSRDDTGGHACELIWVERIHNRQW